MLKQILGAIIYAVAPVKSGEKYCQAYAAKITNPPLLLPKPLAREISQRSYDLAKIVSSALHRPMAPEFEGSIVNLTTLTIELITGVDDDVFQSKSQALTAHPWLVPSIVATGIDVKGIRAFRTR